jgi:hypothetical protein
MSIETTRYADGTLHSETPLQDGVAHGIVRRWHSNGALAEEVPMEMGVIHGTVKHWDSSGRLLGTYQMMHGTGIETRWAKPGLISATCSYIDSKRSGPARSYNPDGTILGEGYWVDGQAVVWEQYVAACQKDDRLPNSPDDEPLIPKRIAELKELERRYGPGFLADQLPKRLLGESGVREATEWLLESEDHSLGEDLTRRRAKNLINKLYALGAVKVHAVEIQRYDEGEENTGRLVVELPSDLNDRNALLKHASKLGRKLGFGAEEDVGQQYMLMMLD